jgi:hypothetical protein
MRMPQSSASTSTAHPLPVVVSLSSWAQHQAAFDGWLVKQLAERYDLPHLVGEQWLQDKQLILLLDGLDEMDVAARPRCIVAINAFRRTHLSPLVVCSRTAEYHDAATRQRLSLQNAIVVQPLTQAQIARELQRGGPALASLREALTTSEDLFALATTPLMFSILILTCCICGLRSRLFFLAFMLSSLSPALFSCILPPPSCVQKNETHPSQRQRFTASVFSGILLVYVCPLGQLGLQKKEQGRVQC